MPAEWERQQSTLIGWPYNKNDWPGKFKNIPGIFAQIISKITKSQEVNLLIKNYNSKNAIKRLLKKHNAKVQNVKFIICKTDRVWMRDTGPIFVKDKKNLNILLNWKFNGWAKYKNYKTIEGFSGEDKVQEMNETELKKLESLEKEFNNYMAEYLSKYKTNRITI